MSAAIKQHILVVDDEPQVLIALDDLLSEKFIVSTASSAEKALAMIEKDDDIAVVLTDQRMPKMTGDQFLAKLGPESSAVKIMVTGYADLTAVVRAVNDGQLFAYVTKPWNEEDLLLKVLKAADQFKLASELAVERRLLQEQTRLLNSVLDGIGDGVIAASQAGEFLVFNPAAERILGGRPAKTSLEDWTKRSGIYESDQKTALRSEHNPLCLAMAGSEVNEAELFVKNGTIPGASVVMTSTPLRDSHDQVAGGVALLRDVTERRRLEAQLLQSQKMEAIGQLAGGVAHDFNNLLAVIHSYGELLLSDIPEGDSKRDDVAELLAAAQRATSLTKQLLAFSRQQPMTKVTLDMNNLVENIEKMLRRLIGAHIRLVSTLAPSLGKVHGDASQMEQIIVNLVVNARDAMPQGGDLSIATSLVHLSEGHGDEGEDRPQGAFICLTVSDSGMGMSPEVQKRIFDPFYTTKDVGKGTGLGLSTVYGIVRQSGGHIEVESEVSKGTSFRIYLPQVEGRPADTPSQAPAAVFSHETILLIEDEVAVRRVASRILRERGYTVLEAPSAEEARRLFARHADDIALVLVDLALPETRGAELARELLLQRPSVRVLFVSGDASAPANLLAEGSAHLAKPFTPHGLTAAVRSVLTESTANERHGT